MPDPAHLRIAHEGAVAVLWVENPPRNLLSLSVVARLAPPVADPEVDLGWMPSHGATARLSKIVGRSRALEILVSGKEVKALDALRLGIVNHLASPGGAFDQAKALATAFASKPRSAVKAIKRALTEGDEKPYRNRFLLESQHAIQLLWTDEHKSAMERLSRTGPTIDVRRPRTRFRKPKQTTRPSAHSPARTFAYESRGSRP